MPNAADRAVPGNRIKTQQLHNRGNSHARLCGHGREGTRRRRLIVCARVLADDGRIDLHCSRAITPHSVHFQRGRRARGHQTAILQNSLPCRGWCGRRFATGSVVILQNLNLPIDQTHAARPFPNIAHQIGNAGGRIVMPPAQRPGTYQCAPMKGLIIHAEFTRPVGQCSGFVLHFMVQAPIRIAPRLPARLDAQSAEQRPLRISHQMPARTFRLAIRCGAVEINRVSRLLPGKRHGVVACYGRRIDADKQLVFFNAVDNKRWVCTGQPQIRIKVFNIALGNAAHKRRIASIVVQNGDQTAGGGLHAHAKRVLADDSRHGMLLFSFLAHRDARRARRLRGY